MGTSGEGSLPQAGDIREPGGTRQLPRENEALMPTRTSLSPFQGWKSCVPAQLWPGEGRVSRLECLPASMATSIVRFKAPSPDPHLQLYQSRSLGLSSSPLGGGGRGEVPESRDKVRHRGAKPWEGWLEEQKSQEEQRGRGRREREYEYTL